MARGSTLTEIVSMVKAELMLLDDDALAPGGDAVLFQQIAMQQKWLALRYAWTFLKKEADVTLAAGDRYYDFPQVSSADVFDLGRPITVHCEFQDRWTRVIYGITPDLYNYLNPANDERSDPVSRWQFYLPDTLQFEVWPLPSAEMTIRFSGQMVVPPLVVGTDTAVLDDILIAQFTAAKLAARLKQADAAALLAQAKETLLELRSGYAGPIPTFNTTNDDGPCRRRCERPTVVVSMGGEAPGSTDGYLLGDDGQVLLGDDGQPLLAG